jgi:UDP-glucose 4-epimerase
MRILITGGAGFIGSHLSDELLARGDTVHVLDQLTTGSIDNIRHLKGRPGFEYTIESAANAPIVAELVDEADVVYHLAAAVGVDLIVESPVRTIETNVHCTEVVLAQASKKKKPIFIASTSEVYGKSTALPFREDGDLVLGPTMKGRWSYACSKAVDEFLALAYHKERGLPTVVGRLFNTVGPRQTGRYGMVVPSFVAQALAGRPIRVYGDGRQRRCFCHVHDVVRALADLMRRDDVYGEVFNIGGTDEITIEDLAHLVRAATGSQSEITLVPYDEAYEEGFEDMRRRIPDTRKIRERLGWEPAKTLGDILTDVIAAQRADADARAPRVVEPDTVAA